MIVQFNDIRVIQLIERPNLILYPLVLILNKMLFNQFLVNYLQGIDLLFVLNDSNITESLLLDNLLHQDCFLQFILTILWHSYAVNRTLHLLSILKN